ncbi:MAG: AMP-binding protein, partial [Candidatus Dormibacteraeota bacterium]|nr:AMP-binding protein [Candidatus Dormibacteraeota bacterium]
MSAEQSQGPAIETMLLEQRRYEPDPAFAEQANAKAPIYQRDPDQFWTEEARNRVSWFQPFTQLKEWDPPFAKWYLGGQLNVCYNCVDRHVESGRGDKVAFHWEGEPADERSDVTFGELQSRVVRFANGLKKLGVGKGTAVAIYMGMTPELPVAMLACTRLGAPHTVVFGGFSPDSLSSRMNDMGCEVLITQDEGWRRGKRVPLMKTSAEAMDASPGVRYAVVLRRT